MSAKESSTISISDYFTLERRMIDFFKSQETRETFSASKELTALRNEIHRIIEKISTLPLSDMTIAEKEMAITILERRNHSKRNILSFLHQDQEAKDEKMEG
ncbi:hypothetical protein SJAG_03590 [Schizosaccharomyces japonicus yFS275]|uniref:Uncharacterized protein n=1 Tax=Schizosaccharomyces japonicus (strain yFS275 / FY16936) TaxID=402676 RepID=B6K4M8_SCHJY|nr:hypothetical protein SJAG_03590 [Schizosaccharomyces japonicus yFS275]EEB08435.1 hypothetical protein SJAG_03590 [Schizosaccharomyces japonicus yFS275]